MVKEYAKEIIGREAKSALEEGGEHHNLICIGCGEVFAGGRTLLQHKAI
jgi:Fe2+ or Zn2+ uptake regulation protein